VKNIKNRITLKLDKEKKYLPSLKKGTLDITISEESNPSIPKLDSS
jgi:hypothetical protein